MAKKERKDGYVGIDYSHGTANIDKETGIRYGVIAQNSLSGEAVGDFEFDYGDPTCPKCGNPMIPYRNDFDYTAECGIEVCNNCNKVFYPMEIEQGNCPDCGELTMHQIIPVLHWEDKGEDFVCLACQKSFDSSDCYPDEAIGFHYDQDGYKLIDCLDTDVMILKSPFYSFAQFCSPCVPGAGNLESPMPNGAKCYALGHDWFEEQIAPYPVYRVSDDIQIVARKEIVDCAWCKGTGVRVLEEHMKIMEGNKVGDKIKCWVCNGTGKMKEVVEKEVENE
jgi:hypothetical protein